MSVRLIIQHVKSSKINQIEQFPIENLGEVTFGRDPDCTVSFDPTRDDTVSRRHAAIRIEPGEVPSFKIRDLGSSNGTYVNGTRISAETELIPGDTVELGAGGAKFAFDLQPRPAKFVARTRVVDVASGTGTSTVMIQSPEAEPVTDMPAPPTKVGVGQATVQRMLSEERQSSRRVGVFALAGILAVVGIVVGGLLYKSRMDERKAAEELAATKTALTQKITSDAARVETKIGMTPEEIVHKFGNSQVLISFQWRLVDAATGRPIYHKRCFFKDQLLPCYVRLKDGSIVRWLTNDDNNHANVIIGAEGTGSGFVINSSGTIMTNKHVAAGWMMNWDSFSPRLYEHGMGWLYDQTKPNGAPAPVDIDQALSWRPEDGGIVFAANVPIPIAGGTKIFADHTYSLDVRFPGSTVSVNGKFVRASPNADAALIKIDTDQSLSTVELAPDDTVKVGEKVTVLGYPGFSVKTMALITTVEAGEVHAQKEVIPEPTVTDGLISRLSSGPEQRGNATTIGDMGDVYQLSVPTGAGNSGGPVFNSSGKVIGLFTYGTPLESVTYAVPIRYGRDLLQVQREN